MPISKFPRHFILLAILLLLPLAAAAQTHRATPEPTPRLLQTDDPDPISSIEEDMRAKNAIRHAEKEYRENVERAHELADLGVQLSESFKKNAQLDREDLKKLDRLEKLTKSIRSNAGGSDDADEQKHQSPDLAATIKEMTKTVDSLAHRVEKTPRHVISAAVIDEANVLLELIRSIRALSTKA